MKKIILFLLIGLFNTAIMTAQCCPFMGNIEIITQNPTPTDNIYLVTNITTPNVGDYMGTEISTNANEITVSSCYSQGFLDQLTDFNNTINLGTYPPGNYVVNFVALLSSDFSICMPYQSNSVQVTFEVTSPIVPNPDYIALRALYLSTDGDNWDSQTDGNPEWPTASTFMIYPITPPPGYENLQSWHGVYLDNDSVIGLYFPVTNNLTGSIPPEIGDLSNLTFMGLIDNNLSGGIPPELGNLSNLISLSLIDNNFNGGIPTELGNLSNLTSLSLSDSGLSGNIPPELGNLASLTYLSLSNSNLNGGIPPELGNLSNLTSLDISNNDLSGSIPSELSNLSNLTSLSLYNNQLSDCYDDNLLNLCNQLSTSTNAQISDGNNFDTPWEDFCATMAGSCSSCAASLPVSDIISSNLYQAEIDVNSDGTVPTGNTVQFKAGQYILLGNKFTVEPNADFSAEIEGCN